MSIYNPLSWYRDIKDAYDFWTFLKNTVGLQRVRRVLCEGFVEALHVHAAHETRQFFLACCIGDDRRRAEAAIKAATACRRAMCAIARVPDRQLHCCIKVLSRPDGCDANGGPATVDETFLVNTLGRSHPMDGRPRELGLHDLDFRAGLNSAWAALLGLNDGLRKWSPITCFGSNDLHRFVHVYRNEREDWTQYYRSTLVVPIRMPRTAVEVAPQVLGFLAFDSPEPNAFRGMPEVFDDTDRLQAYMERVEQQCLFHVAALMADMLSMPLLLAVTKPLDSRGLIVQTPGLQLLHPTPHEEHDASDEGSS
jgi:hypothetical protein